MEGENSPKLGEKRQLVPHDDTELTPGWLRDFIDSGFNITFEPQIYTQIKPEYQPLLHDWAGFSFVHPPHAEAQLWVEKAIKESDKGNHSVLLLPANFNSVYWREVGESLFAPSWPRVRPEDEVDHFFLWADVFLSPAENLILGSGNVVFPNRSLLDLSRVSLARND